MPARQFVREYLREVRDDNVANGAAALAFYLMLAIFPAAIFLLTLLPYLPIPNLERAIMELLAQMLPGGAAQLFEGTVHEVVRQRNGALLSFGAIFTLWSAASGMYAVMQQLNVAYDVTERRPFYKARAIALGLTLAFVTLIIGSLGLVVFGGLIQRYIGDHLGWSPGLLIAFAALRWVIIGVAVMVAFGLTYYFGPDARQKWKFVLPGSLFGVVGMMLAALGFRLYVTNFARFNATYGSLGAVIVLLMFLYITGWVLLLGGELNALIEHHSEEGKKKGERASTRESSPQVAEEMPGYGAVQA